jgi:hypothetical protein
VARGVFRERGRSDSGHLALLFLRATTAVRSTRRRRSSGCACCSTAIRLVLHFTATPSTWRGGRNLAAATAASFVLRLYAALRDSAAQPPDQAQEQEEGADANGDPNTDPADKAEPADTRGSGSGWNGSSGGLARRR